MKRLVILAVTLLICVIPVSAQQYVINQTDYPAYVMVLALDQQEFEQWGVNPQLISERLLENYSKLAYIAPSGVRQVAVGNEALVIAGVFVADMSGDLEDDSALPVFAVQLSMEAGSFSLDESLIREIDGQAHTVSAQALGIEKERWQIDGQIAAWQNVSAIYQGRTGVLPAFVLQTNDGLTEQLDVTQAMFWGIGGTEITAVKMQRTDDLLYVYMASRNRIEKGSRYSLVWFQDVYDDTKENVLEFEIPNDGTPYAVFVANEDGYEFVGDASFSGYVMECQISLGRLPVDVDTFFSPTASIDIYSGMVDGGVVERFPLGTIYPRDIPRIEASGQ
ncbi:MAG: hypothetical protein D6B26_06925 [Spirochaetaceae bacterium]|nr:MAG: hypothetical protein D6B26_06925 [Spirochaetaceae bacterium]